MSLTVSSAEQVAIAADRFTAVRIAGVWTVRDAERALYVLHQAVWDEGAALEVVRSLSRRPAYVSLWTWSPDPLEVS